MNESKIRRTVFVEPNETRVFFDGERYRFVVGGSCKKCAFYDPNADGAEETGCRLAAATIRGDSPYTPCSSRVRRDGLNGNFRRVERKRRRGLEFLDSFFRRFICPFARIALIAAALLAAVPTFAADGPTKTLKNISSAPSNCVPDEEKIVVENERLFVCVFARPACPPCAALKPEIDAFRKTELAAAFFSNVLEPETAAIANSLGIRAVPVVWLMRYSDPAQTKAEPLEKIELGASPLASITSAVVAERARIRAANVVCSVDDAAALVPELPEGPTEPEPESASTETSSEPTVPPVPDFDALAADANADFQFGADVFRDDENDAPRTDQATNGSDATRSRGNAEPERPAALDFRDRPAVRETARPGILDVRPNAPGSETPPAPEPETSPPDDARLGDRAIARIVGAFERAVDAKLAAVAEECKQNGRRLVVRLFYVLLASQIVAIFAARVVVSVISSVWRAVSRRAAQTVAATLDRARDVARNAAESYLERTSDENVEKESNKK